MTEIRFYHMQHQTQDQVLPVILQKALDRDFRIVVKLKNTAQISQMNDHLWVYNAESFLPHGSAKEGNAQEQPIWLTDKDENPNGANVLILGQGVACDDDLSQYALCCEMVDGHNDDDVVAARTRWKAYKEQGYDLTYWQQNERGGWDQKA